MSKLYGMIIPPSELAAWKDQALKALYWDGVVSLPWVWPANEIVEYQNYMRSRPLYNAHVMAKSDGVPRKLGEAETLSYDMADTVAAPHFFEFAVQFTDIVEEYLGSTPHMYSLNAFWTKPGSSALNPDIQMWHRDRDDTKFLALFMYGTDQIDDGLHHYVKDSHRQNDGQHRPPLPHEEVVSMAGPAGTLFFEDASGLHMGDKPNKDARLLAWARWCVSSRPQSYDWDNLRPVKIGSYRPSQKIMESTRLVVDWNL